MNCCSSAVDNLVKVSNWVEMIEEKEGKMTESAGGVVTVEKKR